MVSGVSSATERFLNDLDRIANRMERAQREISSGKRVNAVSDSPDEVAHLLAARSQLAAAEQTHANLNRVQSEVDAGEQALSQAVSLLERVAALGAQGLTDFLPADQRRTLADEIGRMLEQMVGLAATATDGRYVFSGDSDTTQPYGISPSATPPYGVYQGSAATRQIRHPSGTLISVARTAQEIFNDPDPARDVFGAVTALRDALAGDDTAAIRDALARAGSAQTHLNNQLAFYGAAQNQVAQGLDYAYRHELRLKKEIAAVEDADLTAAILELTQGRQQQEAALGAQARVQNKPNLFEYLR